MNRFSPFALLRGGWRTVRAAWIPVLTVMLGFHLLLLIIASPLIGWLFREALRANGMFAVDLGNLQFTGGIGITLVLLFLIMLLAFWLIVLQFVVLVLMLQEAQAGQRITHRGIIRHLGLVLRKLIRPSSVPLFLYLFLILPLSGFGFVSVLSQRIAVPSFISGELLKSPASAAVWTVFVLLLAFLNLRFATSLPVFTLTNASGGRAMRLSWRLTRGWASVRLLLAVVIVLVLAAFTTLALLIATVVPTAITDDAAPDASPLVAGFSLGIAQILSLILTVFVTALVTSMLLTLVKQQERLLPADVIMLEGGRDPLPQHALASPIAGRKRSTTVLIAGCAVLALGLGFLHVGTMQQLAQLPQTLTIGHRGFSGGGAENTIEGLEAAVAVDADMVEIDVMQTADKRFVIMHDANLSRLAGMDVQVKDLTLDELTEITVTDLAGHEGKIPSLEEYVLRAAELEMPLLIEIKLGGLDTPDFVPLLVDELESLGVMDLNIFHTLDHASVEELKRLRPDAAVGYILAFAGVDVPETVADFVVIEEWSATPEMQEAAKRAGLGFFSWTVNEEPGIRDLLRRDADGIITDHPDLAVAARTEMEEETGLAGILTDALTRFVIVF